MPNNIVCPVCHWNDHLDDATYCQSCGTELNNYCKDSTCIANQEDDKYLNALPPTANYCPYCGGETTYHDYLDC